MGTAMPFDEDVTRRVVEVYTTLDVGAQRDATLEILDPQRGERVLDIGSGPGFLAAAIASRVGESGAVSGVDLSEPAQLRSLLVESGVDVAAAEAAYTNALWKDRLRRENDLAIANGVFGAPFFIVDGEPFWGNDRRVQLEAWLSGQADYSHTVM